MGATQIPNRLLDTDLKDIGNLSPSNDDIIQRKSGAWTNRTIAQLKTDLGIGLLFTQTANADVNNTNAETTLIGSGTGSATFAAGLLTAGKTIRVIQKGFISTTSPADSCNLRIKIGGTTVSTIAIDTSSIGASQTNLPYTIEYLIVCRTTGVSGTVMITGTITYPVPTAFGIPTPVVQAIGSSSTVTANTTGTLANDITADWNAAANGRRMLSTITVFEQLN